MTAEQRIRDHLTFLYGDSNAQQVWDALSEQLSDFQRRNPHLTRNVKPAAERLTERDVFLITYGDQVLGPGCAPLQTLSEFLKTRLAETFGGVHILPHFPYSSDDGFSVIDYWKVNPNLGTWDDVASIGVNFRMMFDGVINHISSQSVWFQGFLRGDEPYRDYFICEDPKVDLSMVVRPRTSPLLTPVKTASGLKHVWTTFSNDQVDLNFKNPEVLLQIINLLLFYAEKGAEVIRLDAIAYLWKQVGTTCIHLPQTHRVVKLFRAVFDTVAPDVILITETNVPHRDNISYFGDGDDEAQMVYNFALPPLILHTFQSGNARALTKWAATLSTPSATATYFNFIASHDGIGVTPARGLLDEQEIQALVDRTTAHGGKVSYKSNADGSKSPYELNITLFDALNDPNTPDTDLDVRRFLASQAIMLSLAGVPGVYVHSLFGSRSWHEGVAQTGRARTINRQKFQRAALDAELADTRSLKHLVFAGHQELLRARRENAAFHPQASQRVLDLGGAIFGVCRADSILCLVNVTSRSQTAEVRQALTGLPRATAWRDIISGKSFDDGANALALEPYEVLWLMPR